MVKIKYKLITAFLLIIMIFVVEGLYVSLSISTINTMESSVNNSFRIYQDSVNYEKGSVQVENGVFLYLHNNTEMGDGRIFEGQSMMKDSRNDLNSVLTDPVMLSDLSEMEQLEIQVNQAAADAMTTFDDHDSDDLVDQKLNTLDSKSDALNLRAHAFVQRTNDNVTTSMQESESYGGNAIIIIYMSIIVSVIVSVILATIVSTMITKPIRSLMEVSNKISWGDMNVDINVVSKDEIGDLAKSFNRMKNAFKVMDDLANGESSVSNDPLSSEGITIIEAGR